MKGKPKFKKGDRVRFTYSLTDPSIEGEIYIIDPYGTWEDPSDVSYDILGKASQYQSSTNPTGECLFKHINEKYVYAI